MANVSVTIEGDINEVVATLRGMAAGAAVISVATSEPAPAPAGDDLEELAESRAAAASPGEAAPVEAAPEPDPPADPEEPERPAADWDANYVNSFWSGLSDNAREAMIRVSRSPNHTQRRVQLMHTLNLSQRGLSGSLSSQGHSRNRVEKRFNIRLPRPLTYDKVEDVYILDPGFANGMRELGMS